MKRFFSIVIAVALCVAALSGCGSKDVDLSKVLDQINSEYSLSLQTLTEADELNKYYSINADDVKQFAAEIDPNNDAPVEIVLVEAVDSTAAESIESALTARYNSVVSIYSSYTPEKLDMVKACKVTRDNTFVSLIISDNASDMLGIYNNSIR